MFSLVVYALFFKHTIKREICFIILFLRRNLSILESKQT